MYARHTARQPCAGLRQKRNLKIMTLCFPPRCRWSDMNDICRGHTFALRPTKRHQTFGEAASAVVLYTNPWKEIDGGTREFHYQWGDRWWCLPFSQFCGKVKEMRRSRVWGRGQIWLKWCKRSVEKQGIEKGNCSIVTALRGTPRLYLFCIFLSFTRCVRSTVCAEWFLMLK